MGLLAGVSVPRLMSKARKLIPRKARRPPTVPETGWTPAWVASVIAGLFGGVSHILLDSLLYREMRPFRPLSDRNALAGSVGAGPLHVALAIAGVFGLMLWLVFRDPHAGGR